MPRVTDQASFSALKLRRSISGAPILWNTQKVRLPVHAQTLAARRPWGIEYWNHHRSPAATHEERVSRARRPRRTRRVRTAAQSTGDNVTRPLRTPWRPPGAQMLQGASRSLLGAPKRDRNLPEARRSARPRRISNRTNCQRSTTAPRGAVPRRRGSARAR